MSFEPKRIQRKRTKGWRMPPNTVYVGRPTRWGNPYRKEDGYRIDKPEVCYDLYAAWLSTQLEIDPNLFDELKGKDLACWCALDKPCHADVLLKILKEASQ